jgi:putative transposase
MIEPFHPDLSITRQCELLDLSPSSYYYQPSEESAENLEYMKLIDEIYTRCPFYGSRKITEELERQGNEINRKRVQRLMQNMGIEAIYQKPKTTERNLEHKVYPYLLKDYVIERPCQVWSTDITYIPMPGGFMYLVAIIDWYSRYVLSWRISNTMDVDFCIEALEEALEQGTPEIFNTDQGSQFTSLSFTKILLDQKILISMDSKGRALDNIFVERLWRSVKYENLYLYDYQDGFQLHHGLKGYFSFYNHERIHQSLGYRTPKEVHCENFLT